MTTAFGPLTPVFYPGELPVPGYLPLLHMARPEAQNVLRRVQQALDTPGGVAQYIDRLLLQPDWRGHLVAAVAILMGGRRGPFAEALWAAFDAGSWVAPQLAVTLYWVDPAFVARAKERIRQRCPVSVPEGPSPVERHVATGPAGRLGRSSKNMAALLRLMEEAGVEAQWLTSERAEEEVVELLEGDADGSGEIAGRWLHAARGQFKTFGIELSPPAV